jgi:hypothetical protein
MVNRRTCVYLMGLILAARLIGLSLPAVAGFGLITFVAAGAKWDLAARSRISRRAASSRMAVMMTLGMVLVCAGIANSSVPWQINVASIAQAKSAMFSLACYLLSIIVAPILIWIHVALRETPAERRAIRRAASMKTLPTMAANQDRRRMQMAV